MNKNLAHNILHNLYILIMNKTWLREVFNSILDFIDIRNKILSTSRVCLLRPLLHILSLPVKVLTVPSYRTSGRANITKGKRSSSGELTFLTAESMKSVHVEIKNTEYATTELLYFLRLFQKNSIFYALNVNRVKFDNIPFTCVAACSCINQRGQRKLFHGTSCLVIKAQ
jgi:hypothetical protein